MKIQNKIKRTLSQPKAIEQINNLLDANSNINRSKLAELICDQFNFFNPSGSAKKNSRRLEEPVPEPQGIPDGMVPVHINEYAFNADFPFLDHLSATEMEKYKHIFKQTGYLYSAFGGMIDEIPNLENYKVVVIARDPRDIVVSDYYSIAYSHEVPFGSRHNSFMLK